MQRAGRRKRARRDQRGATAANINHTTYNDRLTRSIRRDIRHVNKRNRAQQRMHSEDDAQATHKRDSDLGHTSAGGATVVSAMREVTRCLGDFGDSPDDARIDAWTSPQLSRRPWNHKKGKKVTKANASTLPEE